MRLQDCNRTFRSRTWVIVHGTRVHHGEIQLREELAPLSQQLYSAQGEIPVHRPNLEANVEDTVSFDVFSFYKACNDKTAPLFQCTKPPHPPLESLPPSAQRCFDYATRAGFRSIEMRSYYAHIVDVPNLDDCPAGSRLNTNFPSMHIFSSFFDRVRKLHVSIDG